MPPADPFVRTVHSLRLPVAATVLGLAALTLASYGVQSGTSPSQDEQECRRGRAIDWDSAPAAFPGIGDDQTTSIGKFRIAVADEFRPLMVGMPGYDAATGNLDSPVLYDRSTQVGRSDPLTNGSAEDLAGVPVGSTGVTVSDAHFPVVPDAADIPDDTGAREIHTAIKRFELRGGMDTITVRAGTDFTHLPLSAGEVRSQDPTGDTALDLPGRSFFNIFVEVELPPNPTRPLEFPGALLYNDEPLLVVNTHVEVLPPRVVYTHEGPAAISVLFAADNGDAWSSGDVLGHLTLAGHGLCFTNSQNDIAELEAVLREHEEIPTPVPPTATATATDLPTATATDLPTATATATRRPEPLFLPLTLSEACPHPARFADVALAVDTSSSMAGDAIAAAREAALTFVSAMRFGQGDQVAIVTFHGDATMRRQLTANRAAARAAAEGLAVSGTGTAIDAGILLAAGELGSSRRRAGNEPVLILLTDGRQSGGPGRAVAASEAARDAGITIYAIGLGPEADAGTLRVIAGAPERYFASPTPAELRAVYRTLAQDLLCGGQRFWPNQQ